MLTRGKKSYGVVLPHFGPYARADLLLRSAKRIEALGFDAVWVRDHLVYEPRPYDNPDITHFETFVVLSALAGITSKLVLGYSDADSAPTSDLRGIAAGIVAAVRRRRPADRGMGARWARHRFRVRRHG